jgi:hypothetical protein
MKKARMVSTHAVRKFVHDCDNCEFLGTLDGQDLYACKTERGVEYSARFGDEGHQYGSLGSLCPEGTPYALAQALLARRNAVSASFRRFRVPCEWRTVGGPDGLPPQPATTRQLASALGGQCRTVRGAWPLA